MNPLRMLLVALLLLVVAGCHTTKPARPQVPQTRWPLSKLAQR